MREGRFERGCDLLSVTLEIQKIRAAYGCLMLDGIGTTCSFRVGMFTRATNSVMFSLYNQSHGLLLLESARGGSTSEKTSPHLTRFPSRYMIYDVCTL